MKFLGLVFCGYGGVMPRAYAMILRYAAPTGLKIILLFWFYKYVAPTGLGMASANMGWIGVRLCAVAFIRIHLFSSFDLFETIRREKYPWTNGHSH